MTRVVALAVALLLSGCQVSLPLVHAHLEGEVESHAEGYRLDPRWAALADGFSDRVRRALDRLDVVAGLRFVAGRVPEVVLRPFGDETVPYELRGSIVAGHRRVSLHVNAEPLISGVRDPDRLLLRGLADAAFQDAAQRHGSVPRWLSELAGTAASGELEEVLMALQRRALAGDQEVYRIDADDAAVAVQTGAAALLLITERGSPSEVRHLLQSVADGDDASRVMARLAHEPDGAWLRPALTTYRLRLSGLDDEAWRLLARAEVARAESGAAGLEAALPGELPSEVADELHVLLARAAADEGDFARAAKLLEGLSPTAPARLREPADALALRIRVESRPGGDAGLARRLALRLDLDFPRSAARERLRRAHPLLGMQEDPQRWLLTLRDRIQREGTDDLDLAVLVRYVQTLLQDHRVGAAQRFLLTLGVRATAPEFGALHESVESAASDPSQAARERGAERVARWQQTPGESTWADVADSGPPARRALATLLEGSQGKRRRKVLALAGETLGAAGMIDLVREDWTDNHRFLRIDLESVALYAPYPILRERLGVRQLTALARVSKNEAQAAWKRLTFSLSDRWLSAHPDFLREIRSPSYGARQAAFEAIARGAPRAATPALVAHGLRDPAALLRRDATRLAGEVGFSALVRRALADPAGLVREEAVRAVVITDGARCTGQLLSVLATDASVDVRGAAALGLLQVAAGEERVIDALLATQASEEVRLRDAIGSRLARLDPQVVVRGIERGWTRALRRPDPSRSYLFRTSLLYQRLTRENLAYYPGAGRKERRSMLQRMRAWIAQADGTGGRTRTGRRDVRMVRADDDGR